MRVRGGNAPQRQRRQQQEERVRFTQELTEKEEQEFALNISRQ